MIARGLVSFGRFWREFLVGDTPELFLAALVVVAVAFATASTRWLAVVAVPGVAVVAVAWSAARGRVRR